MKSFDQLPPSIEERIAAGLARIGSAMRSHAWEQAGASGVTPTQAEIMTLLAGRAEPVRLALVVAQLAITAATASDAVATLVSKGLVKKGRAADDGRAVALSLTAEGKARAAQVANWDAFVVAAAATLGSADQASMLRLLMKMIRTMQERGDIAPARMCISCSYFEPERYPGKKLPHHCHLVGAPFGAQQLRIDCPEHVAETRKTILMRNWTAVGA